MTISNINNEIAQIILLISAVRHSIEHIEHNSRRQCCNSNGIVNLLFHWVWKTTQISKWGFVIHEHNTNKTYTFEFCMEQLELRTNTKKKKIKKNKKRKEPPFQFPSFSSNIIIIITRSSKRAHTRRDKRETE